MKALKFERFTDKQLNNTVQNIRDIHAVLLVNPFIDGRFITQVSGGITTNKFTFVAGTAQTLDHGLGRTVQGVVEIAGVGCGIPPRIYDISASTLDLTSQITLQAAASGSCWIWVF